MRVRHGNFAPTSESSERLFTIVSLQEITLFTDASTMEWGEHLDQWNFHVTWSPYQQEQHIPTFNLMAVWGFLPLLKHCVICLMCYNAVTMAYIRWEDRTNYLDLTHLTIRFLKLCGRNRMQLVPVHIPGIRNV